MNVFPKRGDVWIISLDHYIKSEQANKRRALIIQNDIGNEKAPTTIVATISSTVKIYPMNIEIHPPEGGLKSASIVQTSQILTISKERLVKCLGRLSNEKMNEVDKAIKLSLSLG